MYRDQFMTISFSFLLLAFFVLFSCLFLTFNAFNAIHKRAAEEGESMVDGRWWLSSSRSGRIFTARAFESWKDDDHVEYWAFETFFNVGCDVLPFLFAVFHFVVFFFWKDKRDLWKMGVFRKKTRISANIGRIGLIWVSKNSHRL